MVISSMFGLVFASKNENHQVLGEVLAVEGEGEKLYYCG